MSKKKTKNVKVICKTCKKTFHAIKGSRAEINQKCFRVGCKNTGKTLDEMIQDFESHLR